MINNNARQALSDLLTYHKIKTVDGYERQLLTAINSADSLNIKDVQTFTKYVFLNVFGRCKKISTNMATLTWRLF